MSTPTTILRPAVRPDTSALTHLANAANARSVLHKRIAPRQQEHATDYYLWRRNIVRQRFATPELRTIVAEDPSTGKLLGQASWAVEGSDTALHKKWVAESSTVMTWLEAKLIEAEKMWCRYVTDKSVDYAFLDGFMAAFLGTARAVRPAQSSSASSSPCVPGRGAHGSSLAGRTTMSRSPRASSVTTGSK